MNTIVTEPKTIRVPMAGLSFDKPPAVLETLLGSCVGIAMWDERSGYGGLAHAMLAQSNGDVTSPGKFVDTAISELKRELIAQGATPYSMRAKLAGGAIMFGNNSETVGTKNFEAARHHLEKHRIRLVAEHVGGNKGRIIRFSLKNHALEVVVARKVVAVI